MIDLYQFPCAFQVPNLNPFCMKLEGFLRLADIPFQIIEETASNKAPGGALPYIRDNGVVIADANQIISYLEKKLDFDVDGHLEPDRRALHHACSIMLDEHLYFALRYSHWIDEHNTDIMRKYAYAEIPPPIAKLQLSQTRKKVKSQLQAQGLGKHSRDELYAIACKDIDCLAQVLGDRQWFGGIYVSKLDLSAAAYLNIILVQELSSPLAERVKQHGNLETFAVRALKAIYPPQKPKRRAVF
ncbi:Uncharacterised protein [BD1-7 clade bacterium]|uniref:GST N-terminal domain-containing protein n=1 Tax=BD1-7 clade bacterium TaxID=2029982 RepID=A0A5S9N483_9GAMM|nr:Uncharacterised protein [BD1-7 clade bacterium]